MTQLWMRRGRILVGDLDVSQLRYAFTIEKHLRKEPNTAKISIWGLSEEHRHSLEGRTDGVPVQVEAGYTDAQPLLFRGILDYAVSERSGPDWITNVMVDDGHKASTKRAAISFRAGVSVEKVTTDLAKQLGVGLGNLREIFTGGSIPELGSTFKHGFHASTGPQDALFKVVRDAGYDISVQDEELQVMRAGQPANGESALLNRGSGLIGNPVLDRKGRIAARCLLIGGLNPGHRVRVESTTATGDYRIDAVEYTGDTHRDEWFAEFEGAPL